MRGEGDHRSEGGGDHRSEGGGGHRCVGGGAEGHTPVAAAVASASRMTSASPGHTLGRATWHHGTGPAGGARLQDKEGVLEQSSYAGW